MLTEVVARMLAVWMLETPHPSIHQLWTRLISERWVQSVQVYTYWFLDLL